MDTCFSRPSPLVRLTHQRMGHARAHSSPHTKSSAMTGCHTQQWSALLLWAWEPFHALSQTYRTVSEDNDRHRSHTPCALKTKACGLRFLWVSTVSHCQHGHTRKRQSSTKFGQMQLSKWKRQTSNKSVFVNYQRQEFQTRVFHFHMSIIIQKKQLTQASKQTTQTKHLFLARDAFVSLREECVK